MSGDEFKAVLRGPRSHLGRVRARDVGRLMLGIEAALAASAYVALGKPRRAVTGRHVVVVEAATCLTMLQLSDHPVTAVLALPVLVPDGADTFDLEVDDLAGAALDHLMSVPELPEGQVDRALARSLSELGTSLGIGERHDALTLHCKRPRDGRAKELRLDAGLHLRMNRVAEAPTVQRSVGTLTGSLREVDFDRRSARLLTEPGENVAVTFAAEMADEIQEALRQQVHFEGMVSFDVATSAVRKVELRRISRAEPLPFAVEGLDSASTAPSAN